MVPMGLEAHMVCTSGPRGLGRRAGVWLARAIGLAWHISPDVLRLKNVAGTE